MNNSCVRNVISILYKNYFNNCKLFPEIQQAFILWKGLLIKEYNYIQTPILLYSIATILNRDDFLNRLYTII